MLSPKLLAALREYWKAFRPQTWLFYSGRDRSRPLTRAAILKSCHNIARRAGLAKVDFFQLDDLETLAEWSFACHNVYFQWRSANRDASILTVE